MLPVHDDFHKTVAGSPLKPVAPCSDFKGQTVADQGLVNRVGKQGPTLVLRHAEPPGLLAELDEHKVSCSIPTSYFRAL